ncbi:cytochrome P450 [Chaetomium tenue]|uniref:Cytochrome P450 n=1 Tax=Chaetomium tenue TaxID=1854479 RepID=A0ACB7PQJ7_9PEZI|nr:cytochrome P450 [Chaetomium globosum]
MLLGTLSSQFGPLSGLLETRQLAVICSICLALILAWKCCRVETNPSKHGRLPHLALLTDEEIYDTPIQSMSRALRTHGSVVGFKRNGNIDYLVAKEHAQRVLTDESSFSFEGGLAGMLGITWIRHLHGGSFFRDIDGTMRAFSTRRMNHIVPEIWPLFEKAAESLVTNAGAGAVDIQPHLQQAMAEGTIKIFLSEKYNRADFKERMIKIATDIAYLTGLDPNRSFLSRKFPLLWHAVKVIHIALVRLPLNIGPSLAWELWVDISRDVQDYDPEDSTIFSYLSRRSTVKGDKLSFSAKLWNMVLVLTVMFGATHQTIVSMIWVTFFLAQHPDSQESIRKEASSITEAGGAFKLEGLHSAVLTDSFIREALRTKGDSVNAVRQSVQDVELDGFTIPKGSLVFPFTYQCYRDSDLMENANEFIGNRWVGTGKSATTTGLEYPAFGLGRWACPGRFLAINELKCWILALVARSRLELDGGKYEVMDAFNITACAPDGKLLVSRVEA